MADSQGTSSSKPGATLQDRWPSAEADGEPVDEFKPISRDEALLIAERSKLPGPWIVLAWQLVAGFVFATALGVAWNRPGIFEAALFGCLAVVVPGAVFARGLQRQRQRGVGQVGVTLSGFFVWEMVKIVLVLMLLATAPLLIANLSWLALLAGLVVTLKASWFVLLWYSGLRRGR
jgi:ATP synthase protein I